MLTDRKHCCPSMNMFVTTLIVCITVAACGAMQEPERANEGKIDPTEGMIGKATMEGVDQDIVFHYRSGVVFANNDLPMTLLEGKKFEITLRGELTVSEKTKVKISMAGGGVSHDVNWLYLDDKELGSTGDDRNKHLVKELELEKGTHEVRWVLTGGTFRSNILFVQGADGEFIDLKTREQDRALLEDKDQRQVRIQSRTWGWPIPLDWKEPAKLVDPS